MHTLQQLTDLFKTFPKPVVILDLETTGGNFYHDRITEIAFLHFHHGKITAVSQLIQPQQRIPPFIQRLTGINDTMLKGQPLFQDFYHKIKHLLRGSLLIAHNQTFDYTFLCNETRRAGEYLTMQTLCSVKLSRRLYPKCHKHSLDAIIKRHHLDTQNRHRAMGDVLSLAYFLQAALIEHGATLWQKEARSLLQPAVVLPPHHEQFIQEINMLSDGYGVSIWHQHDDSIHAIHAHQRAFQEISHLFSQPENAQHTKKIDFIPCMGALHSLATKAQYQRQSALFSTEYCGRHSVIFEKDPHDGCLKARIRPLNSGFYAAAPHGLFMNPKAAKRALQSWCAKHGICPTRLGVPLHKNAPSCAAAMNPCAPDCSQQNANGHNRRVVAAQSDLPVCNWQNPRMKITETDDFKGISRTWVCEGGALKLDDSTWLVSPEVWHIVAKYWKHQRENVEIILQAA